MLLGLLQSARTLGQSRNGNGCDNEWHRGSGLPVRREKISRIFQRIVRIQTGKDLGSRITYLAVIDARLICVYEESTWNPLATSFGRDPLARSRLPLGLCRRQR